MLHVLMLLLIEPVWNRNIQDAKGWKVKKVAFNRTSLESKQFSQGKESVIWYPFNRTSLESKRDYSLVANSGQ